jgi:hypothetical protein
MEENMREEIISQYYSNDKTRKAILAKDYITLPSDPPQERYICRLYKVTEKQELILWGTRLVNKNLRFAEDLCENFVEGYGEFKVLEDARRTIPETEE